MSSAPAILVALGGATALALLGDVRLHVAWVIPLLVVWGTAVSLVRPPQWSPWRIVLVALVLRGLLTLTDPGLSDDLYRYLWEGRVVGLGENPFVHAPNDPHWPDDPIRNLVNHPELSTIYPPIALWFFAGVSALWYDPNGMQVAMGVCDAGTAGVLALILRSRGQSTAPAWLYALHPLAVVESAHGAHLEALALLLTVLAIWRWEQHKDGGFWAMLAAGTKLLPAVLLVPILRRNHRGALLGALVLAAATLPFVTAGPALWRGFGAYATHWSFNSITHGGFVLVFGEYGRWVALAAGALVTAWTLRWRDAPRIWLWVGGAFVLLSPTLHPWYVVWAWVPALLLGVRAWTVLATLVPLAYVVLAIQDQTGGWTEPWWPRAVFVPIFLAALLVEAIVDRGLPLACKPPLAPVSPRE